MPKSNKYDAIEQIESHWKTVYDLIFRVFAFGSANSGVQISPIEKLRSRECI